MDIYDQVEQISNKADFIQFLKALKNHLISHGAEWENDTLEMYLEGLYGYCYDTAESDELSWKAVAKMFIAAKVYE